MNENFEAVRAANILAGCVSSVFADMAFIDVLETGISMPSEDIPDKTGEKGNSPQVKDKRRISIDVLMPLSCRIELQINTALRDRVVDTLFGDMSNEGKKNTLEDSLLEMLNIIAGSFLSEYFGAGTEIQLELPRYQYLDEQPQGQTIASISMNAEGEPVTVILESVRYRY